MQPPQPVCRVVEEWIVWATWQNDSENQGKVNAELIGFDEFDWVVRQHPEHAWECILATVADPRAKPYLGTLAAGPIEDLLGLHGDTFIDRVEQEARRSPLFAWTLGAVWQCQMTDEIWARPGFSKSGTVVDGTAYPPDERCCCRPRPACYTGQLWSSPNGCPERAEHGTDARAMALQVRAL